MGIVAYCPQGHRVKVKADLAGKKGLCPTCGMKFRIPHAGDEARDRLSPLPLETPPAAGPAGATAWPTARIVSVDPAVVATLPRALAAEGPTGAAAPVASGQPAFPPSPFPAVPQRPWHPAIAERPDLAWSIAQPGGEPSPSLSAEGMQAWLDAHQWTGEEYVWRADWPEWLPFRQVFADRVG